MDKFTRSFFNSILNDGGSPIYSSASSKIKSPAKINKPPEEAEMRTEVAETVPETKLPTVGQEESVKP